MPAGVELLSENDHDMHWGRRQRLVKNLREIAWGLARQQRIPRLARARFTGVYEPPDRRKRDAPNLYPSFKACIDGITDAGVLPDDNDRFVLDLLMRPGEVFPGGRIVLHITEVTE